MTANDLLRFELDHLGRQIALAHKDAPESFWDIKCSARGMTPREIIEHLAEAYQAFITARSGGKHEWGKFRLEPKSVDHLTGEMARLRAEAVASAVAAQDDKSIKDAFEYLVGHDAYHVGQFVLARLQVEPEWDAYSIYS